VPTVSPYRPGFGQSPMVLAGRDESLEVSPGQPFLPTLVERAQVLSSLVNDEPRRAA